MIIERFVVEGSKVVFVNKIPNVSQRVRRFITEVQSLSPTRGLELNADIRNRLTFTINFEDPCHRNLNNILRPR